MILDELKVPFRWYEDVSRLLKNTDDGQSFRFKLITPKDRLLPFMFRYPNDASITFPQTWKVYNSVSGALVIDLAAFVGPYLDYYKFDIYDYVVYKGQDLEIELPEGYHYSVIEMSDGRIITSEDFWIDCDAEGSVMGEDFSDDFNEDFGPLISTGGLPKYTKIEWWNNCDIGNLLYQTGYHNILYLESGLERSEPQIIEEGSEDGKKDFVPTFIKYIDNIRFTDFVPEYIITALLPVGMHRNVVITTAKNLYTGSAKNFRCTHEWQNSQFGIIECKFQQETTFLRANCCTNNEITDYYKCSTVLHPLSLVAPGGATQDTVESTGYTGDAPASYLISCSAINGGTPFESAYSNVTFDKQAPGNEVLIEMWPQCDINGRISVGASRKLTVGY